MNEQPYFCEYGTNAPYFKREEEGDVILVGSSGRMLLNKWGEEINKCSTIVRMNVSPSKGYENNVGNRTDIRIVAFNAIEGLLKDYTLMEGVKKVFVWTNGERFRKTVQIIGMYGPLYRECRFFYLSPHSNDLLMKELRRKNGTISPVGADWVSTGLAAVFTLTLLYRKVKMVGFGDFSGDGSGAKVPYHYWKDHLAGQSESQHYTKNQIAVKGHRFIVEKMIILDWSRKFGIKIWK